MCLLPAAIVFVGGLLVMVADEYRTGKEATEGYVGLVLWSTLIFAILGILCR